MSDQTKQQETRSLPATFAKNEFEKDAFILRQLVTKDFKIKYRRSVLGVAWSVLNPLLMMIVMAIVFSTIFGQGRNGSMTPEMYPLYLIVGNITFAVMSESTNQALTSIVGAAPLLKKVKVHRWVFPVQKVLLPSRWSPSPSSCCGSALCLLGTLFCCRFACCCLCASAWAWA